MMNKGLLLVTTTALSLVVGCVTLFPANAAPGMDVFSNVTPGMKDAQKRSTPPSAAQKVAAMTPSNNPALGAGSMAMMSTASPALSWFEKFDEVSFSMMPTDADRVILKTNFNQEAERVIAWTKVAGKVAHNYRLLAQTLKGSSVPPDHPALKQYQDLMAGWYNDKASVYEDLIRPRAAAKTIEELKEQLQEINDRADSIASANKELHQMDMHLRDTYHVHQARQTDKLWQYVSGDKLGPPKK